ncbi:hypothetical protein ETD86_28665 [Nonomuraea turkmeniaca]|uniref:LPXTG cell wall anchor domain-containing protein n=1 Tax=Nonomuraea turkmeniaca TaxID=103838 RepID=A0A5S4FVE5_9ACTN|nr:hypothetical protein [Nonomuraea turkmeniaca]TMR14395.1 hypothetical protein ETD86_28665 [Nonomuraea turkmeniaca]
MRAHLIVPILALQLLPAPGASVVEYECTTTDTGQKQQVKVDIELTVPARAAVDENLTIGWRGTYVAGSELRAPSTGLEGGLKLYAYAGISGISRLTSATGVGQLGTITPGQPIPLPTATVNLTTTPQDEGNGTVHAAAINFGTSPQDPVIECEVKNKSALTEHPLAIGEAAGTTTPSTSPTTTPTTDDNETDDPGTTAPEATTTVTTTTTVTPEGGVDTGAGGEAGPDGQALMLAGSLVILSSATGLLLRRRRRRNTPQRTR